MPPMDSRSEEDGRNRVWSVSEINRLVRELLESAVIDTVAEFGIEAYPRRDAPGVYVEGKKLAAIGLRVRRGCSYHGLAFNIAMDLAPYARINPCGFADLEVTQLADLASVSGISEVRPAFERALLAWLGNERTNYFSAAAD